jgi:transcriptional regulator with XRE-family HTH domain
MKTSTEVRRRRLSQLLKSKREELDLSQRGLAESLGYRQGTIHQWEAEKADPDVESLENIAEFCGYSMQELWSYLNGNDRALEKWDTKKILNALDTMQSSDLAIVGSAVMQKLAQAS